MYNSKWCSVRHACYWVIQYSFCIYLKQWIHLLALSVYFVSMCHFWNCALDIFPAPFYRCNRATEQQSIQTRHVEIYCTRYIRFQCNNFPNHTRLKRRQAYGRFHAFSWKAESIWGLLRRSTSCRRCYILTTCLKKTPGLVL